MTVIFMEPLANGLVTVFNGLQTLFNGLLTPVVVMGIAIGGALAWLALIELDELNRQGTKPEIERGR